MLRVGVLVAGAWAKGAHLPGFARDARCEVVAIADPQQSLARSAADVFGVPSVESSHHALIERDESIRVNVMVTTLMMIRMT